MDVYLFKRVILEAILIDDSIALPDGEFSARNQSVNRELKQGCVVCKCHNMGYFCKLRLTFPDPEIWQA